MNDWIVAVTSGIDSSTRGSVEAWKREPLEQRREGRGIGACAAEVVEQDGSLEVGRPAHKAAPIAVDRPHGDQAVPGNPEKASSGDGIISPRSACLGSPVFPAPASPQVRALVDPYIPSSWFRRYI